MCLSNKCAFVLYVLVVRSLVIIWRGMMLGGWVWNRIMVGFSVFSVFFMRLETFSVGNIIYW